MILSICVTTLDISAGTYHNKYIKNMPLNDTRYCRNQMLRVDASANYLMKYIYDRSFTHTRDGYLSDREVMGWRDRITFITLDAADNIPRLRGLACRDRATANVWKLNAIWEEVKKINKSKRLGN